jgi:hypothetical protein
MIQNYVTLSDGTHVCSSYNSPVRRRLSFRPGDSICVSHPNPRHLKHKGKIGIILDRPLTRNGSVWIQFDDGSLGAAPACSLIPSDADYVEITEVDYAVASRQAELSPSKKHTAIDGLKSNGQRFLADYRAKRALDMCNE